MSAFPSVKTRRPPRPAEQIGLTESEAYCPWWLHPLGCLLAWMAPMLLLAWAISPEAYMELWMTPKFVTAETLGQGALLIVTLSVGLCVGLLAVRAVPAPERDPWADSKPLLAGLFWFGFWLTLTGNGLLLAIAAARGLSPAVVIGMLAGEHGAASLMKEVYFVPVTGVTSLTQFAPATMLLGLLLTKQGRTVWGPMALIVALCAMRAFFVSERLALLEVVIPAALLGLRLLPANQVAGAWRRLAIAVSPVFAVMGLVALFTAFEYNRSWINYYATKGMALWEFGLSRLTGYYVTAINNSAMCLANTPDTLPVPFFTLEGFWEAPGVEQFFSYESVAGVSLQSLYGRTLVLSGNPEFNNPGGLLLPIYDYGLAGATIYWLVVGVLIGVAYVRFRQGSRAGLLFYPLLFEGLLELPRLLYCTSGRIMPTMALLALAWLLLVMRREPRASRRSPMAEVTP